MLRSKRLNSPDSTAEGACDTTAVSIVLGERLVIRTLSTFLLKRENLNSNQTTYFSHVVCVYAYVTQQEGRLHFYQLCSCFLGCTQDSAVQDLLVYTEGSVSHVSDLHILMALFLFPASPFCNFITADTQTCVHIATYC